MPRHLHGGECQARRRQQAERPESCGRACFLGITICPQWMPPRTASRPSCSVLRSAARCRGRSGVGAHQPEREDVPAFRADTRMELPARRPAAMAWRWHGARLLQRRVSRWAAGIGVSCTTSRRTSGGSPIAPWPTSRGTGAGAWRLISTACMIFVRATATRLRTTRAARCPTRRMTVFKVCDLSTGASRLVLSLAALHERVRALSPLMEQKLPGQSLSRSTRPAAGLFCCSATSPAPGPRAKGQPAWLTTVFTADRDGGDLRLLVPPGYASHYHWRDDTTIAFHCDGPSGQQP